MHAASPWNFSFSGATSPMPGCIHASNRRRASELQGVRFLQRLRFRRSEMGSSGDCIFSTFLLMNARYELSRCTYPSSTQVSYLIGDKAPSLLSFFIKINFNTFIFNLPVSSSTILSPLITQYGLSSLFGKHLRSAPVR